MYKKDSEFFAKIDEMLEKKGMTYLDYLASKEETDVKVSKIQLDRFLYKVNSCTDCPVLCYEDYVDDAECKRRQKEFLQVKELEDD